MSCLADKAAALSSIEYVKDRRLNAAVWSDGEAGDAAQSGWNK